MGFQTVFQRYAIKYMLTLEQLRVRSYTQADADSTVFVELKKVSVRCI